MWWAVSSAAGAGLDRTWVVAGAVDLSAVLPPGVDVAHQRVRSASLVLPPDRPFKDAEQEALVTQPGRAPVTV